MNLEVTSAAKKPENFFRTPAAVFVITAEDIRRSGATSIPELLRMVPGLNVAHIDANKWAISVRGFNELFADKLLVLIDGRTVFTPLFSGVYWDVQDTLLEDINRIEVIRGPGATMWGANAVNGVINVITKQAKDTQGTLLSAGGGNQEHGFGTVRYGGKLGDRGYYRLFAKYFNRGPFAKSSGNNAVDGWNVLREGFRTDWKVTHQDSLTVQGDFYNGSAGGSVPGVVSLSPPTTVSLNDSTHVVGGNLLGRWNHAFSARSDTTLQLYYDRADRRETVFGEVRHTIDFDFDHHLALGNRHDIVWGLGYRFTTDRTAGSLTFSFNPSARRDNLYNGFIQDEITLLPDRLHLILGTKLEHNDYTGLEVQPNIRMIWAPHPHHAIWAAVSRSVETPSRFEANGRLNDDAFPGAGGTPVLVADFGNPRLPAESVLANELGYRAELSKGLSLDLVAFYNIYHNLHTEEPGASFLEGSPPPPHLVFPEVLDSKLHGETHGIEIATNWNVTSRWTLRTSYTALQMHLHPDPSSADTSAGKQIEGESPKHKFHLKSQLNLPHNLELDTALYYVSRLSGSAVPGYTRLDTRLGWQPAEHLELGVVVQNLLDARHRESGSAEHFANVTQVKRSVYGKLTWRF
jgi:iron complex outermembrane receptor protein